MSTILLTLTGAAIYFIMEFQARATTEFQLGYWFKQNYLNVILSGLFYYAYIQLLGDPSKEMAFALGLVPNLLKDWIQDIIKKYSAPKNA